MRSFLQNYFGFHVLALIRIYFGSDALLHDLAFVLHWDPLPAAVNHPPNFPPQPHLTAPALLHHHTDYNNSFHRNLNAIRAAYAFVHPNTQSDAIACPGTFILACMVPKDILIQHGIESQPGPPKRSPPAWARAFFSHPPGEPPHQFKRKPQLHLAGIPKCFEHR